jgi:hypothetical protein
MLRNITFYSRDARSTNSFNPASVATEIYSLRQQIALEHVVRIRAVMLGSIADVSQHYISCPLLLHHYGATKLASLSRRRLHRKGLFLNATLLLSPKFPGRASLRSK